jgi:hypothetical protein
MKKISEITDRRRVFPISLTEDLVRAMLLHSRDLKGCPRPRVGSVSYYVWVAVIEKLARDGVDMKKISEVYSIG